MRDNCRHCGAPEPVKLGRCEVCELSVCAECGNTQHRAGEKVVVHDACLGELGGDGFSMIKFVK
jgi:hypothetical protein